MLVNRHDRKAGGEVGESARGSSAFAGAVDIVLHLMRPEGASRPTIRKLKALSRFEGPPDELMLKLTVDGYVSLGSEQAVELAETRELLLARLPVAPATGLAEEAVTKLVGKPRTTVRRALDDLLRAGSVERLGAGKRGDPRLYRRSPTPEKVSDHSTVGVWSETNPQASPAETTGGPAEPAAGQDRTLLSDQTSNTRWSEGNETVEGDPATTAADAPTDDVEAGDSYVAAALAVFGADLADEIEVPS